MERQRVGTLLWAACAAGLMLTAGCVSRPAAAPQRERGYASKSPALIPGEDVPAVMPGEDVPAGESLQLDEQSQLPDYLAYAAIHNPGLKAAFNRWKAAIEQVPQVKALPDPRFTYRYFIEQVETRVGAQRQGFGLTQTFPWFGKLDLRGSEAAAAANVEQQRFEASKLKLFRQVKDAYYEYYYLGRAIAVVKDNRDLVRHFESVARTRYKVAEASQPDVIRAQVEFAKLDDRLRSMQDLRKPVMARLNAALNRPMDANLPWPTNIDKLTVDVTDQQWMDWLIESNPVLQSLNFEIVRNQDRIALAKKNYFPDVTLGVNYIDTAKSIGGRHPGNDGKDPVIAMVSVNLPIWWDKLAAGLRQAEYRHTQTIYHKLDMTNTLSAEMKLALYHFHDAERKLDLYDSTLLPKANESVKVTETSFMAGKGTFLDLIDAQRILLEFQLDTERALANRMQSLAELEMLAGKEVPVTGNAKTLSNMNENRRDIMHGEDKP